MQRNSQYGYGGMSGPMDMPQPDGTGIDFPNSVIMFYTLHELNMNCERLFNLCCLYGNVMRVNFKTSKSSEQRIFR